MEWRQAESQNLDRAEKSLPLGESHRSYPKSRQQADMSQLRYPNLVNNLSLL